MFVNYKNLTESVINTSVVARQLSCQVQRQLSCLVDAETFTTVFSWMLFSDSSLPRTE